MRPEALPREVDLRISLNATASGTKMLGMAKHLFLSLLPSRERSELGMVIAALAAIPHSGSPTGTYSKDKVLKVVSFHRLDSTKTLTSC